MQKLFFIVICCFCHNTESSGQERQSDKAKMGLKGKVHRLIHSYSKPSTKRIWDSTQFTFNKKGNIIEEIDYSRERGLDSRITFKYDRRNRLIEQIFYVDTMTVFTMRCVYLYDADQNLVAKSWYNENNTWQGIDSFRYHQRVIVEERTFSKDGIHSSTVYRLDDHNRVVEKFLYDAKSLVEKHQYTYNNSNFIDEEYWYDSTGKLIRNYAYAYDRNGNKTEEKLYNPDGSMYKTTWLYDVAGNILQTVNYGRDDIIYAEVSYKYEFDKKKNIVNKVAVAEGKISGVSKRTITYY